MPIILQPSLLDRSWATGYSYLGMPMLFGSNDIGLEKLTGSYSYLGMPLLFWSNAI